MNGVRGVKRLIVHPAHAVSVPGEYFNQRHLENVRDAKRRLQSRGVFPDSIAAIVWRVTPMRCPSSTCDISPFRNLSTRIRLETGPS